MKRLLGWSGWDIVEAWTRRQETWEGGICAGRARCMVGGYEEY